MGERVLVTGGAGFIGSHLVDALVEDGHDVTVLDSHEPQVHGAGPAHVNKDAAYVKGDVRDKALLAGLVKEADVVFHDAAVVGVGQSMYEVDRYVDANVTGTARLLDVLVNEETPVRKLVVASSNTIYGEGAYACPDHGVVAPPLRARAQLEAKRWDVACPDCGTRVTPAPVPETKPLQPTSVYALTKRDQEAYALLIGRAYGMPVVALRYFCVYGPRQSLSNPYTGVCAIFSSRLKNGKPPVVYEDGWQTRDFVSVHDVVQANLLAMRKTGADYEAVNVGTGRAQRIRDVAATLGALHGSDVEPDVPGSYRAGDIRHCFADVSKARKLLGYAPRVGFEDGLRALVTWSAREDARDAFEDADAELTRRGLVGGSSRG